jgi:hypothetical protein
MLGSPVARRRTAAAGLLGAIALTAAAVPPAGATARAVRREPRAPVHVVVEIRRSGVLRVRDHTAVIDVAIWCSEDTSSEIDAVLEQHTADGLQRAARGFDIPCGRRFRPLELVFEGAHFRPGAAHLVLQAMAGFGERFGETTSRVGAWLTPATR